jgi:hypothetical protein
MPRSNGSKSQPPRHGVIRVSTMKVEHAKQYLSTMTASATEVRDCGEHAATGFGSQGAMSPGGASGADYETTSVGDTPDSDSKGATGY